MRLKKVHVNSIRVVGILGLMAIVFIILTVPNVSQTNPLESVEIVPQSAEDIINEAKGIATGSIVDTDVKYTESNDSLLTQFLDSSGSDLPLSTEKFGIEVQTALFDSNQNKYLNSTVFGVSELSVLDEQGRVLDLGSIQTSFAGVTRNTEKSINIWGTVKFYLDDNLIDTKKLWASSTNQKSVPLFVVSNLSFVDANVDYARISTIEDQIISLKNEIISLGEQSCVNCNGRDTEIRIRDDKITALNIELVQLKIKIDEKMPSSPSFSDRKTNFTFTLSDEGSDWKDGDDHYYRVVLTDINASIDSDNDFKEFSWSGEYVAYELKVKVDETKTVVFDIINNNAIQIFKSDDTVFVTSPICCTVDAGASSPKLPVSLEFFVKNTGKSLGVLDNNKFVSGTYGSARCGGYPVQVCSTPVATTGHWNNPALSGIPRGTDIVVKVSNGNIIEFKTPVTQHNYFISCNEKCTSDFGFST